MPPGYRNEDNHLERDEHGFPFHCTPDQPCTSCRVYADVGRNAERTASRN